MKRINGMNEMNDNIDTDSIEVKQFTPVYHTDLGKGSVVSVTYRRDNNNLVMCYFPNGRCHDWITEKELRSGMGDIALTRVTPKAMDDRIPNDLQSALENLFAPR
jgi:hypothetical protein